MEERFRKILDSAPDAIVIVDQNGIIDVVNVQTEKMSGYTREEMLGEAVEILLPERYRDGHPGFRDSYAANPRVRPMGAGIELHARRRDGSEIPVEISLSPMACS